MQLLEAGGAERSWMKAVKKYPLPVTSGRDIMYNMTDEEYCRLCMKVFRSEF